MNKRVIDFRYAPWRSQCCIGLVDDYFKTIIEEDGSVAFDYIWPEDIHCFHRNDDKITPVHNRIVQNYGFRYRYKIEAFGAGACTSVKQTYSDPEKAIVYTEYNYERIKLETKAFSWKSDSGARVDVIMYDLYKPSDREVFIKLATLGLEPPKRPISYDKTDIYVSEVRHIQIHRIFQSELVILDEESSRFGGAFFIVHEGNFTKDEATYTQAEAAYKWCHEYWLGWNFFKKKIQIPDEDIMKMLYASARNIFQAREVRNHIPTFQVGPTRYRNLWMVDGYFMQESGHILGWDEDSFAGLYSLLKHVHPDGSINIIDDHDKETAIAIATIIRQCELKKDDQRLVELSPTILRAIEFIRWQRDNKFSLGEN